MSASAIIVIRDVDLLPSLHLMLPAVIRRGKSTLAIAAHDVIIRGLRDD